jgi:hypothetical protein
MYPWLDELLARWRRQGRRPPITIGREFLSLSPGPLRDLIQAEIDRTSERDIARISRTTTGWSFAVVLALGLSLVLGGVTWESALSCVLPALGALILLWPLFQWALIQDSRRLTSLLAVLSRFESPEYVCALLPLLPYHPADMYRPLKSLPNPRVEEHLLTLLPNLESRHALQWDARDWLNYRTVLRTPHRSVRLAIEAIHGAGRMGSVETLSALRPLAASSHNVYRILGVDELEAGPIRDAARIYIRQIEVKLAGERQAATLLRSSHVRETSRDDELVRPVPLHDATPYEQLLHVATNGLSAAEDLLRVANDDRRE